MNLLSCLLIFGQWCILYGFFAKKCFVRKFSLSAFRRAEKLKRLEEMHTKTKPLIQAKEKGWITEQLLSDFRSSYGIHTSLLSEALGSFFLKIGRTHTLLWINMTLSVHSRSAVQ